PTDRSDIRPGSAFTTQDRRSPEGEELLARALQKSGRRSVATSTRRSWSTLAWRGESSLTCCTRSQHGYRSGSGATKHSSRPTLAPEAATLIDHVRSRTTKRAGPSTVEND